ncbi:MAG: isoaspartyl peptidase/L-asparaginase [Acidobacteria bacterium]|nr:isoaspartyl peptidase/L-asparaginase [Acidobacteriota bacterium]
MKELSRRGFLQTAAVAAAAGALKPSTSLGHSEPIGRAQGPLAIASANGLPATQKAIDLMRQGADTLDAAIAGVNIGEEDPNDHSVGYGGLPNEDGIVELDSCVMHGPTHKAGAVAAIGLMVLTPMGDSLPGVWWALGVMMMVRGLVFVLTYRRSAEIAVRS